MPVESEEQKVPPMKIRVVSFVGTAVLTLGLAFSASAVPVTYYIDSSQSTLTLSGQAFGLPFAAQAPGSLVDAFTGTITGDLTGGVLTFSGGSSIVALLNPAGPFTTAPNVLDGPGNYGVKANGFITGYGLAAINGVYRNLVFDITAGTVQDSMAPSGQTLTLTSGTLDYGIFLNNTPFQAASSSLVGKGGLNTSASAVTLTPTTLVLPVKISTGVYSNRQEDYLGVIVAVIPEPGVASLGLAGLLAAWMVRRRNARSL